MTTEQATTPAGRAVRELRARRRLPSRPPRHCSLCLETGHNRGTCRLRGLAVWTNGADVVIAKSAAWCARLFNDPLDMAEEADLLSEAGDWSLVLTEPLEVLVDGAPVRWDQATWIRMNGEGWLAIDGQLAPGRRPL